MKTFFLTILTLYFASHIYLAYSLWILIPAHTLARIIMLTILVLGVVTPFIFFAFGESLPIKLSGILYRVGTSWMIAFLYLLILVLFMDLFKLSANILHFMDKESLNAIFKHNGLTSSILVGITALILFLGNINYHNKKRIHLNINNDKFEQPMRIVAISDLHLGHSIGKKELRKWINIINREKPDMILIAGDLIDNQLRPLIANSLDKELRKLIAPAGIYACTGNHEYISGIKESSDFYKKAGITLLRDTVAMANGINIIGREDFSHKNRKSLSEIIQHADKEKFTILLDHQPNNLDDAKKEGIDLQLSGHTHNGQVFPASLVTNKLFELSHGYKQKGNTHYYVSSGLGIWGGKFRIGTQSEYVVIDLGA